jgi:hypothetical protein
MSEKMGAHSPQMQQFLRQVETALVQAAADARELAERTGTPLVVRETGEHQTHMGIEPASSRGD